MIPPSPSLEMLDILKYTLTFIVSTVRTTESWEMTKSKSSLHFSNQ